MLDLANASFKIVNYFVNDAWQPRISYKKSAGFVLTPDVVIVPRLWGKGQIVVNGLSIALNSYKKS
tara:strand:- start:1225 stop:1422 length:198 start_codon:yes stop_codon:yes gene_type:complete